MKEDTTTPDKPCEQPERSGRESLATEYLDFQLSKAYASMFESGKHIQRFYLMSILFISFGAVLILGGGVEQQVAVPFLGLKLERLYAAFAAVLLCCASFYSLITAVAAERLLSMKICDLIAERYGRVAYHWYLFYPSTVTSPELTELVSRWGKASSYVPATMFTMLLLGPIALTVLAGAESSWTKPSVIATVLTVVMQLITACVAIATPFASANRKNILGKIED